MTHKFGKIENGVFIAAPKKIKDANFTYFNPTAETYLQHGYLPVQTTDYPVNSGRKKFKQVFRLHENIIIVDWEEVLEEEIVTSQEQSALARIEALEAELAALKASLK